jgi:hypothetical protein
MNFEKETWIGACMKAFDGHLFELAVDRLDGMAMGAEIEIIPPIEWLHVVPHLCDEPDASLRQDGSRSGCTDVALITQQRSAGGQSIRQLMHGCQIVQRSWQEREAHRLASQRTDQMQTPTKELLIFSLHFAP